MHPLCHPVIIDIQVDLNIKIIARFDRIIAIVGLTDFAKIIDNLA